MLLLSRWILNCVSLLLLIPSLEDIASLDLSIRGGDFQQSIQQAANPLGSFAPRSSSHSLRYPVNVPKRKCILHIQHALIAGTALKS